MIILEGMRNANAVLNFAFHPNIHWNISVETKWDNRILLLSHKTQNKHTLRRLRKQQNWSVLPVSCGACKKGPIIGNTLLRQTELAASRFLGNRALQNGTQLQPRQMIYVHSDLEVSRIIWISWSKKHVCHVRDMHDYLINLHARMKV